jgi:hypothetical protein
MPKPGTKPNRVIRSPQIMEALIALLRPLLKGKRSYVLALD